MKLDLLEVRKIWSDGRHNAFTDLIEWNGVLYSVFRTGDNHASPDGKIVLIKSVDRGENWEKVREFAKGKLDLRDPKLVADSDNLYVHCFSMNKQKQKDAFVAKYNNDDGKWTEMRRALAEDNVVIWDPQIQNNKFYAAGYKYSNLKEEIDTIFLESENGLDWEIVSTVNDDPWSNEASLIFEEDGSATILVRRDRHKKPVIAKSNFPFKKWKKKILPEVIQGFILYRVGNGYIIAGRIYEGEQARTAVYSLKDNDLVRHFVLPSGGDTSYPGIVRKGSNFLMSYYSSHEKHQENAEVLESNIYLAEFELEDI